MCEKTTKEAYLLDAVIRNSHNLHSTITHKLQKYTDLKEELIRIWNLKMACTVLLVLTTIVINQTNYTKVSNCSSFSLLYIF